jgi:hypothetical protein
MSVSKVSGANIQFLREQQSNQIKRRLEPATIAA